MELLAEFPQICGNGCLRGIPSRRGSGPKIRASSRASSRGSGGEGMGRTAAASEPSPERSAHALRPIAQQAVEGAHGLAQPLGQLDRPGGRHQGQIG